MEAFLLPSSAAVTVADATVSSAFVAKPRTKSKFPPLTCSFAGLRFSSLSGPGCFSSIIGAVRAESTSSSTALSAPPGVNSADYGNRHWMVLVEAPPRELTTKPQIIDFYVSKLRSVVDSEKDAQTCIYDASCDAPYGFCCDIDEETVHKLSCVAGVRLVRPDPDINSVQKDYSFSRIESTTSDRSTLLFPTGTTKRWLVRTERPAIGAIRKVQMVDYYVQLLMRVLRNEKDAQMCIYHISWQSNYGFCCELDDQCAQELAAMPGVLSVQSLQTDENYGSDDKDYGGENVRSPEDSSASILTSNIETKKLFVTGLSFYTSEKTLRAAFEGFGELVEVKIIMDKISKRSKGYGFVEYTTEEAAGAALSEMNGQIINGWMITVDVAKINPPKYSRGQQRPTP